MSLPPETWERIDAILAAGTDNFLDLVRISGLDPKRAFRHADLRGNDLRGADLRDFNFTGAIFDGADVRGTDFSHTRGLSPDMFLSAHFDATTRWPPLMREAMRQQSRKHRALVFWPDGKAPDWADDWGTDQYGRWVSFSVAAADGTRVTQRMRWIPPGKFTMGSPDGEPGRYDDEGPRHEVTIAEGFWLFDTPCTQALWQAVMVDNPSNFKSPTRPVEQVSFNGVQPFVNKLNALVPGIDLSLPSEARWEYACRAGTPEATYAGEMQVLGENNAPVLDAIAWYGGNSGVGFELDNGYDTSGWREKQYDHANAGTHPVGQKAPNPWGLYDMLGNVWEWCADRWHDSYVGAPDDGSVWIGRRGAADRVFRCGSWIDVARDARAACRSVGDPADRSDNLGFRCARVQSASTAKARRKAGRSKPREWSDRAATTSPKRRT